MKTFELWAGDYCLRVAIGRPHQPDPPHILAQVAMSEFRKNNVWFEGPYGDWAAAQSQASGYDAPAILERAIQACRSVAAGEAAYERDTVLFREPAFSFPLILWLLRAGKAVGGHLRVLDFGGALGSLYAQHKEALAVLDDVSWAVVEQAHIAQAGREEFSNDRLSFFSDFADACHETNPNVILCSGVLQYLEKPFDFLSKVLTEGADYIIIDRLMARRSLEDQVYLQHVPAWIYEASYPVWFLNAETVEQMCEAAGYERVEHYASETASFGTAAPPDILRFEEQGVDVGSFGRTEGWPYLGWLFRRRGL